MSTIDVRVKQGEQITRINFSDGEYDTSAVALEIYRGDIVDDTVGIIHRKEGDYTPAVLYSKKDAENMIAALKTAIELGWLK